MLLNILKYPNKILLKPSQKAGLIDEKIKKLISDMIETMRAGQGCGLAAPQVGFGLRIAVVDAESKLTILINPEIVKASKESEIMEEGCLSLPDVFAKIKRPSRVEVKSLDIQGKEINFSADGLLARIIQHEVDHLDGKLILDRVNFFTRRKLSKKLTKNKLFPPR